MPSFFKRGLAVFGALTVLATATFAGVKIGGADGTAIVAHYSAQSTVNPQSIAANSATTSAVTVTGAVTTDLCKVGVVSGDFVGTTSTGLLSCLVTSTSTATIYYRNVSSTAAFDAGSNVFRVQVWRY